MTIQEAIRSGKPFRRKNWHAWFILKNDAFVGADELPYPLKTLPLIQDILADDWEVKREPREWLIVGIHTTDEWRELPILEGPEINPERDRKKIRVREVIE